MIKRNSYTPIINNKYDLTIFKDVDETFQYYTIIAKTNQRLDILAKQYYGDQQLWWIFPVTNPNILSPDSIIIDQPVRIKILVNLQNFIRYYRGLQRT